MTALRSHSPGVQNPANASGRSNPPSPARGALSESAVLPPAADNAPRAVIPPSARGDYSARFDGDGTEFSALRDATAWMKAKGFSVGRLQAGAPIGILFGNFDIQKWRNLDAEQIAELHGRITSASLRYRSGPVTIAMDPDAPAPAIEAFRSDPDDLAAREHVEGRAA